MLKIDLNCDLGESFGHYTLGMDEEILPYISSANVACGFHAADPMVMAATVARFSWLNRLLLSNVSFLVKANQGVIFTYYGYNRFPLPPLGNET